MKILKLLIMCFLCIFKLINFALSIGKIDQSSDWNSVVRFLWYIWVRCQVKIETYNVILKRMVHYSDCNKAITNKKDTKSINSVPLYSTFSTPGPWKFKILDRTRFQPWKFLKIVLHNTHGSSMAKNQDPLEILSAIPPPSAPVIFLITQDIRV